MPARSGAPRLFDQNDHSGSLGPVAGPSRRRRASFPEAPTSDAATSYGAQRDAPLGGQALIEGVMMRGVRTWAVAVRTPLPEQFVDGALPAGEAAEGGIEVAIFPFRSVLRRHRILRAPVVRGVVALGESLRIGFRSLQMSANAQYEEPEDLGRGTWVVAALGALVLAIGLFFVAPVGLTSLLRGPLGDGWRFWLVEGLVRTAIFLGYLVLITRMADLRRVFEYHGAEHQTIACYEAGQPLTPENASRFSRLHPRCGTSFLLIVMIVAIFVFAPLGMPAWYWLVTSRILGVPLIAGVSFELLKFAGRHRGNRVVQGLMWPGLQLQRLTTRPPDHDQLRVAIAALEAVLSREDPRAARPGDRIGIEVAA